MITCTKCGVEKEEGEYYVCRGRRRADCKACHKAMKVAKRKEDPEAAVKYLREWRAANPLSDVKSRAKHARKRSDYNREWRRNNPEKHLAKARRNVPKRDALLANLTTDFTEEVWGERLRAIGGRCHYCPERAETIDHLTPLSRGGPNLLNNMVPACKPCNMRKGKKTYDEYMSYLELLKLL